MTLVTHLPISATAVRVRTMNVVDVDATEDPPLQTSESHVKHFSTLLWCGSFGIRQVTLSGDPRGTKSQLRAVTTSKGFTMTLIVLQIDLDPSRWAHSLGILVVMLKGSAQSGSVSEEQIQQLRADPPLTANAKKETKSNRRVMAANDVTLRQIDQLRQRRRRTSSAGPLPTVSLDVKTCLSIRFIGLSCKICWNTSH